MIKKADLYDASCDRCHRLYHSVADRPRLTQRLIEDGWRVCEDGCVCPMCLKGMVRE